MTKEQSTEEVEAEYRATLLRKTNAMKAEEERLDKVAADEKMVTDAEAAKVQRIAEIQEVVEALKPKATEIDISAGDLPMVDPAIDNQGADGKGGSAYTNAKTQKEVDWMEAFLKRNDYSRTEYASTDFLHGAGASEYAFTESDSGCGDDVSAWTPADVWCNSIWYAAQCGRQLSGVVTMRACDIKAGDGLAVQIRTISADAGIGNALGPCECASCVGNTFDTHTLTLQRFDIYKVACNLDLFSVGPILKESMIQTMADAFIAGIDAAIYTALSGATPGQSEQLASDAACEPTEPTDGTCCRFAANLYREIIQLEATMRAAGYGKKGFKLILHPTVALYLKYKEGVNPPPWVNNIVMEGNVLAKVGSIEVIEYCGATACTDLSEAVVGILLDPTRAVGEAYGKKPSLKIDEDPIECDSMKYVMRSYFAVSALDLNAIGHIINPT